MIITEKKGPPKVPHHHHLQWLITKPSDRKIINILTLGQNSYIKKCLSFNPWDLFQLMPNQLGQ